MRLIDADALKQKIAFRMWDVDDDCPHDEGTIRISEDWAIDALVDKQPTVDAVPVRHGKWIYGNEFHWYTASCNQCGYKRTTDIKAANWNAWKYCPMCGARMDDAKEEIL